MGDLTNHETKLLELSLAGDYDGVKELVEATSNINIDCTDKTGMTPLQQSAFRGHEGLCKYLLSKGANVNSDKHENAYTALMFGALSGNEEVVRLLLEAGAETDKQNSVHRTAAEMAAFVSQHHIVGIINTFLPSKELVRFTKPAGLEKEPKLKPDLLKPFHQLISSSNLHPVHILLYLKQNTDLVTQSRGLRQVLDKLVLEKMAPHGTHEALALKLHYYSCVLEKAAEANSSKGGLDGLIKRLCKGRESDGFLDQVEKLARSTLRSFPRADSTLFCMLLQKLDKLTVGESPTAIEAITDAINGTRMRAADDHECITCGTRKPKQCTRCHKSWYCNAQCQQLHWATHKRFCKAKDSVQPSAT